MGSPKKHQPPFRPVDTLSSPQKPPFRGLSARAALTNDPTRSTVPPNTFNETDSDYDLEGQISLLGNSISSFDGDPASPVFIDTKTHNPHPRNAARNPNNLDRNRTYNEMVREKDAPPLPPREEASSASAPVARPLQELRNPPPQFGQTSPLRNPLKKSSKDEYAHLFNKPRPGQMRPEHRQGPIKLPSQYSSNSSSRPQQSAADRLEALNRPFKVPSPAADSRPGTSSSTGSDLMEIPGAMFKPRQPTQHAPVPIQRPHNPPSKPTLPPPRPIYSSMDHNNGFQAFHKNIHDPFQAPARQTVILDDEPYFDPDAAIHAGGDRFGAPDLYAYVDSDKAHEDMKALLEGAFNESGDKIPRTRGRKKKQKQEADDAAKSLADRLQALDVKEKAEEDAAAAEEDEGDEEDDGTVEGLKVKLLPHQVDGVAWMIEKETGEHSRAKQIPKGGILADDMGLGKTVQSMAVILSNPRPEKGVEPANKKNKILDITGKGTLVVAPLALIKQWEAEINSKVAKSHALKVLVHHGPNRTKSADNLKQYDVVITTYQVLSSEHASSSADPDGVQKGVFGVHWYRTMLDEAHTIKNRNAKMTKACYDIRSHYRWCLTGTPMQNNLEELQSLIRFLRIKPYSDLQSFKDQILQPMKSGRGNFAMRRLQAFLKACMMRRTKDVLKKDGALNFGGKKGKDEKESFQIVARNVETVTGEFTVREREFYDRLSDRAQARIDEMMNGEKQDYMGALVLLLRLRQACDHPNLTKSNVKDDKDALTTGSKSTASGLQTPRKQSKDTDADDLADLLGGLSVITKRCDICQNTLTRDNAEIGAVRCMECENDLHTSAKKSKKHKKKKDKSKHEHHKSEHRAQKVSRPRPVIVDSDDEEGGEWLVDKDQQQEQDLGRAGGTDDEDAEGVGESLASIDSAASVDEESRSNLDSFIEHDTDSDDDVPIIRKKPLKAQNRPHRYVSEDETATESEDESESASDDESEADDSDSVTSEISYDAADVVPSTKIRQLLAILEKETPGHKVIVFSQFTSMLDLIEPFLKRSKYSFTRYDGSMRNDLREASLHKLRNDKNTRVLLCSLKCGSLGLNLTCASRVVIMEPFWNPFVEEQAIDRVHRLNQTVDVTVYRLSIRDTVEERILELQEAKKKLANAALEGGKAMAKLDMKDMLALFSRGAEHDQKHVDREINSGIFEQARVLDSMAAKAGSSTGDRRKAGSLGLRKEHSVYGRR